MDTPQVATIGDVTFIDVTVSNRTPEPLQRPGRPFVAVRSGDCTTIFHAQRFEEMGGHRTGASMLLAPGESRRVAIPVVISSQHAVSGAVSLIGGVEQNGDAMEMALQRVATRPPEPERVAQYARDLQACGDLTTCSGPIEYFRYVHHPSVADRLVNLLREFPFFTAAAEAVFTQLRQGDAAVIWAVASATNADTARLAELARRLETGDRCPGE